MMPPKIVPRALVSLGIRITRMAGCVGPLSGPVACMRNASLLNRGRPGLPGEATASCYPRATVSTAFGGNGSYLISAPVPGGPERRGAAAARRRAPAGRPLRALRPLLSHPAGARPPHPRHQRRRRGGPAGGLRPGLEPRRALRPGPLLGIDLAGADRPQPRHRPAARPQGDRADAGGRRAGGAGPRGAPYIPGSDPERIDQAEARARAARARGAAARATAGPGDGLLRGADAERDRRPSRPAAGHGQDAHAAGDEEAQERPAGGDKAAVVSDEPTPDDLALLTALAMLEGGARPAPPKGSSARPAPPEGRRAPAEAPEPRGAQGEGAPAAEARAGEAAEER